jgi:hypothetical protein
MNQQFNQLVLRRDQPVICLGCGRQVERHARQQKYCCTECRKGVESAELQPARSRDTRPVKQIVVRASNGFGPDEPPEKANDFRSLQKGVFGPARVIAVEIFAGRAWQEVVSHDGVRAQVSVLRQRALRNEGVP